MSDYTDWWKQFSILKTTTNQYVRHIATKKLFTINLKTDKIMSKKVVLITGTNSGFGWLTANSLASLGYTVYGTMRDTNGKNADRAKALARVENVTVLDVSLTDEKSVKNAIETIVAKEGTIDILINNAGVTMFGITESASPSDVNKVFDVNVIAPWRLMKLALPFMRKQGEGLIINISSGYGRFSSPFFGVYSASKFALEGLSESSHYELRPLGVDVAIIQPGGFPTEMSQKIQYGSDASVIDEYKPLAEFPEKMFAAMGQMFDTIKPNPQEVADAVIKLVSLPQGQRPLRTVVDPSIGEITKKANDAVHQQYTKVLTAYGLEDLLN
ncbi:MULTISPECIES: SDR family oxidoreductase [Sphingobacterium]|uniref:SDR family oxidoreductase n=1 Tax=Sphingobacterium TaxID=28453 RepID=UPI001FE6D6B9|nr:MULTISPECIES: SDR family oxidoreductase [Sphingobacterium]